MERRFQTRLQEMLAQAEVSSDLIGGQMGAGADGDGRVGPG